MNPTSKKLSLIFFGGAICTTIFLLAWLQVGISYAGDTVQTPVNCVDNLAGDYPCNNINLLAHLPLTSIGAADDTILGSDHWSWRDAVSGRDFVIFGMSDGTSFIDVTDPSGPIYLGKLPSHSGASPYRDIKVYADHAYIVADEIADHGMQIFDLTQLRDVNAATAFTETAHFNGFGPGHNMWINEATGFAYVLRTDTCIGTYMLDLTAPAAPTDAGCYTDDGVASDAQCVNYIGPDADHTGKEICVIGSDQTWLIGDVTDKDNPQQIYSGVYPNLRRAHQGTLTEDHRYYILSDTMDEMMLGVPTTIYIFDVADLDAPALLGTYSYDTNATDHNIYVKGQVGFQTNWKAGLRVLDLSPLPSLEFEEVAYFDIAPGIDSPGRGGSWSSVPWWDDGVVTVSGVERGLFILQLDREALAVGMGVVSAETNPSLNLLLPLLLVAFITATYLSKRRTSSA